MTWSTLFSVGCVASVVAFLTALLTNFAPRRNVRVSQVAGRLDRCARAGCGHTRIKHFQSTAFQPPRHGCSAVLTWPHKDPITSAPVPYSTCPCDGFVEQSTVVGGK